MTANAFISTTDVVIKIIKMLKKKARQNNFLETYTDHPTTIQLRPNSWWKQSQRPLRL